MSVSVFGVDELLTLIVIIVHNEADHRFLITAISPKFRVAKFTSCRDNLIICMKCCCHGVEKEFRMARVLV